MKRDTPTVEEMRHELELTTAKLACLRNAALYWLESTDDPCQCGYFEETVSEVNPEGMAQCGPCWVRDAVEEAT